MLEMSGFHPKQTLAPELDRFVNIDRPKPLDV